MKHCNAFISQACRNSWAGQHALLEIFEQIAVFFRRLVIYIEVPLSMEMMKITIQIMVEVLSILGLATKAKTKPLSKYLLLQI